VRYGTSLAVVNADQFPALFADHPELFAATERMIGYWFWELEHIPRAMRNAFDLVDEVWAGSQFVTDAFTAVARVPVHHVPIPVPEPVCSPRARSSFAPLGDLDGRFVFAVVLDHFSVTERKNPAGAIEAFRRAFAPDEGPVLVVKTMNGEHRWPQHRRLHAAAAGRPDIRIWDEHLDRGDHMAFIAAADALVSLHRSEGLGLHLAEAMWLRTPVIATRYSGNLDFMDDTSAVLVDAAMIPVTATGGEGVYPVEASWADPDLDQAAAAMRRLVSDPAYTAALAAAARRRMADQPSAAATAARIATLLGIDQAPASATDVPC
jgi:glycosyltransferase involved in cell wall biosynthesis